MAGLGVDLIRAIGPAPGIGRPRWDALARDVENSGRGSDFYVSVAHKALDEADMAAVQGTLDQSPSVLAFEAVVAAATPPAPSTSPVKAPARSATQLRFGCGKMRRTGQGLRIDLEKGAFADWLEGHAQDVMAELHARFEAERKD